MTSEPNSRAPSIRIQPSLVWFNGLGYALVDAIFAIGAIALLIANVDKGVGAWVLPASILIGSIIIMQRSLSMRLDISHDRVVIRNLLRTYAYDAGEVAYVDIVRGTALVPTWCVGFAPRKGRITRAEVSYKGSDERHQVEVLVADARALLSAEPLP